MGAFDKQPITFTQGKGWFKTLQQFAADSHFKLYHVDSNHDDYGGITLVNGWEGWLSVSIFSFDSDRQFRLLSGMLHNPNIAVQSGQIYKAATVPNSVDGYIGYSMVGAGTDTWYDNEHGMITNGAFYIYGDTNAGKDTWFNVSGLASY